MFLLSTYFIKVTEDNTPQTAKILLLQPVKFQFNNVTVSQSCWFLLSLVANIC